MGASDRAKNVRLMAFDIDGVMTDGHLYFTAGGEEIKAFHSRDGVGVKLLQSAGIEIAIVTGRTARVVELRAQNLGIRHLRQGIDDKRGALADLARDLGLDLARCGYMGDDVVDLPVLRACGFSASVPDGDPRVRAVVDYVSMAPAGAGAVREVCEFLLRAQGRLEAALEPWSGT
jgi:3-deoxy-D-manno-octulosonate 8-phosphate phosphatase (KDO 8-P phosphatase)